jgi:hypothetical protein
MIEHIRSKLQSSTPRWRLPPIVADVGHEEVLAAVLAKGPASPPLPQFVLPFVRESFINTMNTQNPKSRPSFWRGVEGKISSQGTKSVDWQLTFGPDGIHATTPEPARQVACATRDPLSLPAVLALDPGLGTLFAGALVTREGAGDQQQYYLAQSLIPPDPACSFLASVRRAQDRRRGEVARRDPLHLAAAGWVTDEQRVPKTRGVTGHFVRGFHNACLATGAHAALGDWDPQTGPGGGRQWNRRAKSSIVTAARAQLERYLHQSGLPLVVPKEYYTSQRCPVCGCVARGSRDTRVARGRFQCLVCGHRAASDFNGALNIGIVRLRLLQVPSPTTDPPHVRQVARPRRIGVLAPQRRT